LPDCKMLWEWAKLVDLEDANAHATKEEEAHYEISWSHSATTSIVYLSSYKYSMENCPRRTLK